jgi:transcriptional regulator with XRE-family HTH domain
MSHTETQKAEARLIGQRLRWAREAQDIGRPELAERLGVDITMVRNMEIGERVPSVFLAMSLCHILGISPQYLLWGMLQGVEGELSAKLAREHPELPVSGRPSHAEMPNPGKTRKSVRSSRRDSRMTVEGAATAS